MADEIMRQGYYSVVKWRDDVVRNETKNVAVILVDPEGAFGGMRLGPKSAISGSLRDHGLLDSVLDSLQEEFSREKKPDLGFLKELHENSQRSIVFTEPKQVIVGDERKTLDALYGAYLKSRRTWAQRKVTRGQILRRAVETFTQRGYYVREESYAKNYPFGLVIENGDPDLPHVAEAISFEGQRADWMAVERTAGSFIGGVLRTRLHGFAIVQPPTRTSRQPAIESHDRVISWFESDNIRVVPPDELEKEDLLT
jgi:hypothetical protein